MFCFLTVYNGQNGWAWAFDSIIEKCLMKTADIYNANVILWDYHNTHSRFLKQWLTVRYQWSASDTQNTHVAETGFEWLLFNSRGNQFYRDSDKCEKHRWKCLSLFVNIWVLSVYFCAWKTNLTGNQLVLEWAGTFFEHVLLFLFLCQSSSLANSRVSMRSTTCRTWYFPFAEREHQTDNDE